MMMARVRWVVPGGSAGACIALMWPQTGFAARKIFAPLKITARIVIPSREDGEGPRPSSAFRSAQRFVKRQVNIARVRQRLPLGEIPRRLRGSG